jgi:hypothetical protein
MRPYVLAACLLSLVASSAAAQTPATGRVMREKLGHTQKILEAIMTSNFAVLERESAALEQVTRSPGWDVLKSPEYKRQSEAFMRATQALQEAAKSHDLDAAALRYASMTLACFDCHRYVKNARVANR